jgi:hypothetical protein
MTIIEELKEIGAMMGIKPVGNNILEIVKSMKQQLEAKKVPVSNEIKTFVKEEEVKEAPQETFKETAPVEEAITESAPEEKPLKRSKKKADKETTVKFTAE